MAGAGRLRLALVVLQKYRGAESWESEAEAGRLRAGRVRLWPSWEAEAGMLRLRPRLGLAPLVKSYCRIDRNSCQNAHMAVVLVSGGIFRRGGWFLASARIHPIY